MMKPVSAMIKKGFTLIELIMVIAIVAILSVSGAYLMVYLVQNEVFIPNQLNMDMLAQDALNIMIEGDSAARGLRFSRSVTGASVNQVTFRNQSNQTIAYRLDAPSGKLYRSINGSAEAVIPYYLKTGITLSGKDNALFTYYDTGGLETGVAQDVRRVKIALVSSTGSGSYADWEGQSSVSSSVKVWRFE